jgi:hypothetical protein
VIYPTIRVTSLIEKREAWSRIIGNVDGVTWAILNGRFTFPAHYRHRDCQFSDAFADLISAMLKLNASDRPTAAEVAAQCEQMLMDR